MALVRCVECNKKVSDQAQLCPNCGFDLATHRYNEFLEEERIAHEFSQKGTLGKLIHIAIKHPIFSTIVVVSGYTFLNELSVFDNSSQVSVSEEISSQSNPVEAYQKENGLVADGIIGKNTCGKLDVSPNEHIGSLCEQYAQATKKIDTALAKQLGSPSQACQLLKSEGHISSGWKHHYDSEYGCSTPYLDIGTGSPLANNIAYYLYGNATSASEAKLVINVNNTEQKKQAHQTLLVSAKKLSSELVGELPEDISSAISNGGEASTEIEGVNIRVIVDVWPTGKGYEQQVIFQ